MQINLNISNRELTILAVAFVVTCGIFVTGSVLVRNPDITPASARNGWSPEAAEEAAPIVAAMPSFEITDENGVLIVQSNERANVRLWEAALAVRGQHFKNTPQAIGDCVSWASKHACEYLICVEMTTGPPGNGEFHEIFAPYIYGVSRVFVGKGRLRSDGSCGAWAAKAVTEYGILRSDYQDVPEYGGSIARLWGKNGPPQKFVQEARNYLVKIASPVRTSGEIRDAICNGYPVTIASNVGFDKITTKDGRLVGVRSGSWSHAMAIIGYDGLTGSEPYWYVINSWGEHAHGTPIDGSPPGGFWIRERDMQAIAQQGDSFAYSGFDGFKARPLNFRIFGSKGKDHENRSLVPGTARRNSDSFSRSRVQSI